MRVVAILAAGYAAVYGVACFVKYQADLYCDFDLAIFAQATNGILHGNLFSSIRGMNWLGDHVSLVLFPLAPLFALWRDPRLLLIVQTLALASGALAVHRIAYGTLRRRGIAIGFAALYLLYPALGYTNLYEFHPETLATPALLFAFAFAGEGRTRAAVVAALLALLTREDAALPVLALAVYLAFARVPQRWRTAGALAAMAAMSLVLSFGVLLPGLNAGEATYGRVYAEWGPTTTDALINILAQPQRAVAFLVWVPGDPAHTVAKLQMWLHLLLPLGFLPLLAPGTLAIALPTLFEHLLSWRTAQHSIAYQYTALITPWFVVAAVHGTARLVRWMSARRPVEARGPRVVLGVALAAALASQWLFGPLVGHGVWQRLGPFETVWPTPADRTHAAALDSLAAAVPPEGGVVAGFELLDRFALRPNVHSLHHVLLGRYTFSNRPYPLPGAIVAVLADLGHRTLLGSLNATSGVRMRELMAANGLRPARAIGEAVLWARGVRDTVELLAMRAPDHPLPQPARFDGVLDLIGRDSLPQVVPAGRTLPVRIGWRRVAPVQRLFPLRLELLDGRGTPVFVQLHAIGYDEWPFHEWPLDRPVLETLRFELPRSVAPGTYTLAVTPEIAGARPAPVPLGRVRIVPPGAS